MTPEPWLEVGGRIRTRRVELFLSVRAAAARANISEGLWRQLEAGRRPVTGNGEPPQVVTPKPATRAAVALALDWTEDSIDRLLKGGEPVSREEPLDAGQRIARLEAEVEALWNHVKNLMTQVGELLDDDAVAEPHFDRADG